MATFRLRQLRHPRLVGLGIGLGVALGVLLATPWLEELELVTLDWMMRLRTPREPDPRIVLVDIDAASLDRVGRWPWPRTEVARLVDALAVAQARVVALDMTFPEPSNPEDDAALARAFDTAGNVVLGYYFRDDLPPAEQPAAYLDNAGFAITAPRAGFPSVPTWPALEPNLDLLARTAAAQGFFSTERPRSRGGNVLRHYQLVVRHGDRYFPALGLVAAARFAVSSAGTSGGNALELDNRLPFVPGIQFDDHRVENDEGGRLWLNYRGDPASGEPRYRTLSAVAVMEGEADAALLRDRLVFVGASEVRLGDLHNTPFGVRIPGVESHAQAADTLLNDDYIHDRAVHKLLSRVALFLLAVGAALLVVSTRRYLVGSLAAIALVLLWPAITFAAFAGGGWHLQTVPPVLAGGVALVIALRYQVGRVETRRRQVEKIFRHYVSASVVQEMLDHPEKVMLRGEERPLTVLFSDVSGFTAMSEKLTSEQAVEILNQLFTPMTALVLEEGGTFDKYMGDCLMAFFGAPIPQPDHAARACRTALAMARELPRLNAAWEARGLGRLALGIGLNSGVMTVGNMGSETIFDYTVIGDNVNLGSRVEGLTRVYRVPILVTGATAEAAGESGESGESGDRFVFRELDHVMVKGKSEPVTIHELISEAPATPDLRERLDRFAEALAAYRRRDFEQGAMLFEALLKSHPGDGPTQIFRDRCRQLLEEPPEEDWQPVERMLSK